MDVTTATAIRAYVVITWIACTAALLWRGAPSATRGMVARERAPRHE